MFIIVIMYKFALDKTDLRYNICPVSSMMVKLFYDDALDFYNKYFNNKKNNKYVYINTDGAFLINKKDKSVKVLKRNYVNSELRNQEIDKNICLFLKLASLIGINVKYEPITLN